jgi:hypothetical protein
MLGRASSRLPIDDVRVVLSGRGGDRIPSVVRRGHAERGGVARDRAKGMKHQNVRRL